MVWGFYITPEAEENLNQLDSEIRKRVVEKLKWFANNFDDVTPLPLGGKWKGLFKLRVGDWRVIYEPNHDKDCVVIHLIGRRDEIYKQVRH